MQGLETVKCVEILGGNVHSTDTFVASGLELLLVARPAGGGGGGDVYCIHSCGHGALAKFVLLDLAGHGQGRDAVARSVHTLLHRLGSEIRPGPLLSQLNRRYDAFVPPPIYATAVSAVYEPERSKFRFANAGQPRPFHWSVERSRWAIVEPAEKSDCGLPLGIKPSACYREESLALDEGDLLLFTSDGLTEIRNPQDEFLEPEGVLEFLEEFSLEVRRGSTLAELASAFLRRVEAFQAKKKFEDDVTLLWLRRLPQNASAGGNGKSQ
jgi:sigma-B regulation protein RsbU (phosphoserine phosphatase)